MGNGDGTDVILIDDDDDVREIVQELFATFGVRCVGGRSLDELRALGAMVFACPLVILDVNLGPDQPPGTKAYEWLIEQNFPGRVVFLTGHARNHPLVVTARESHALVLEKPVSAEQLRALAQTAHAAS
jgi:FixJ family two-component response regulator